MLNKSYTQLKIQILSNSFFFYSLLLIFIKYSLPHCPFHQTSLVDHRRSWHGMLTRFLKKKFYFLFTYLFSIKFLYFLIISPLLAYSCPYSTYKWYFFPSYNYHISRTVNTNCSLITRGGSRICG
jgi:hypothetical protein